MFHVHRWSKWVAWEHYNDISWGGEAASTTLLRRCSCGMVRTKSMYGVLLPLAAQSESAPAPESKDAADE